MPNSFPLTTPNGFPPYHTKWLSPKWLPPSPRLMAFPPPHLTASSLNTPNGFPLPRLNGSPLPHLIAPSPAKLTPHTRLCFQIFAQAECLPIHLPRLPVFALIPQHCLPGCLCSSVWMDALCPASSHTAQALWKRSPNKVHQWATDQDSRAPAGYLSAPRLQYL
jgi:hypothetical protein